MARGRKFALTFPRLYNISQNHHIMVHDALSCNPTSLSFRRALVGGKEEHWAKLVDLCSHASFDSEDKLTWVLSGSREYSVGHFTLQCKWALKPLSSFFGRPKSSL